MVVVVVVVVVVVFCCSALRSPLPTTKSCSAVLSPQSNVVGSGTPRCAVICTKNADETADAQVIRTEN